MKPTSLIPVHVAHGCAGDLLRTAKGVRAFDAQDREIGTLGSSRWLWLRLERSISRDNSQVANHAAMTAMKAGA